MKEMYQCDWCDKTGTREEITLHESTCVFNTSLHEMLFKMLWRYSMENGGQSICWIDDSIKYYIAYNHHTKKWERRVTVTVQEPGVVYFNNNVTADAAIDLIVKPFMVEHPDFVL